MNDCVAFCDVFVCVWLLFDWFFIFVIAAVCCHCYFILLLLVMQTWECLMNLSDWLIVVYVCMVLLLASMNGCVALCDLSKRLWIDVDWFFIFANAVVVVVFISFHFIHCFLLILIFDHGMASPYMNSDKVNCCMRCFIYCFVINSLTPLCFHFLLFELSFFLFVPDWHCSVVAAGTTSNGLLASLACPFFYQVL